MTTKRKNKTEPVEPEKKTRSKKPTLVFIGRKPKLTQDIINIAVKLLEAGHFVNMVCDHIGVDQKTWYTWINKGKDLWELVAEAETDSEADAIMDSVPNADIYLQFHHTIKRATSVSEQKALAVIMRAGTKNWQARAWFLERRFRDRWSRPEKGNDTGGDKKALDRFLDGVDEIADEALSEDGEVE